MITPNLERLLLGGQASMQVHNHAFGMFGRIPVDRGKIAIITQIIWHPFINPQNPNLSSVSISDFFKFCEYQLKIDSKPNTNFYSFRNGVEFQLLPTTPDAIDTSFSMADILPYVILQPKRPIIIDTFQICADYIKLTISRNDNLSSPVVTQASPTAAASELLPPLGLEGVPILATMESGNMSNTIRQVYNPPGKEYDGLPPAVPPVFKYRENNYVNNITPPVGADFNSTLSRPDLLTPSNYIFPFFPLVTFHVVYINKEIANTIMHT